MHGLEDACSLLGLPPHEKYATSTEAVVKATRAYLPSATVRAQLDQLGWQLLTNYVVRNADCHSKNIALHYTQSSDVAYTPAYDIVTTQAYPRFADNPPGLLVGGRKTWAPGKSLEQFYKAHLGISPRDYAVMVERLCESAVEVGREIIEAARNEPRWHDIAKQMLHAWDEGMTSLRSVSMEKKYRGLNADIQAAGSLIRRHPNDLKRGTPNCSVSADRSRPEQNMDADVTRTVPDLTIGSHNVG